MSEELDEAMKEFISECDEMLESISLNLAALEKKSNGIETINSLYRSIHTIKGSSQLFGFGFIGTVAHTMEACLDPIRKEKCSLCIELIDGLYKGIDLIGRLLDSIKQNGAEEDYSQEFQDLIPKLVSSGTKHFGENLELLLDEPVMVSFEEKESDISIKLDIKSKIKEDEKQYQKKSSISLKNLVEPDNLTQSSNINSQIEENNSEKITEPKEVSKEGIAQKANKEPIKNQKTNSSSTKAASSSNENNETIRVQVGLLDNLMNLVGELVLIRNQFLQYTHKQEANELKILGQQINVITSQLQNEVMKTRMQPIGNILTKFHRVVRDLSKELNKKVELNLEGAQTELDKTLIEAIKDPLTHIVRNSVDHGIECPEDRKNSGKDEVGNITINAYHEGGQVVVDIIDNGKGLDKEKLLEKSLEKGVINENIVGKLSEKEIFNLIFAPGFSTAQKVSNISGRGVGMDVVKNNIEKIGGLVDINSEQGKGTTISLKIPLTLAIVPALVVRSRKQRFAIPQVKLVELLRIENFDSKNSNHIEILHGEPVYRLRGRLLPLVNINKVLELGSENYEEKIEEISNIVVLNSGTQTFGLIVDDIEDSADIVVKPLSQFLKSISMYTGATVLGDGTVALTLDVVGMSDKANLKVATEDLESIRKSNISSSEATKHIKEFLLVDIGLEGKYALPLDVVQRLEEFEYSELNYSGEQVVVRYRETLLPIIDVNKSLEIKDKNSIVNLESNKEKLSIVVCKFANRMYGLQVKNILDVISTVDDVDTELIDRSGIYGNLVYKEEVIVILDTDQIISKFDKLFHPKKMELSKALSSNSSDQLHDILIVEDSKFFRKQIKTVLEENGYRCEVADDGVSALKLLNDESKNPRRFSAIVSDIEMPNMDGLELAKSLKNDKRFEDIPLMAVTTRFRKMDIELGITSGFDEYLEKLKPNILIEKLENLIRNRVVYDQTGS